MNKNLFIAVVAFYVFCTQFAVAQNNVEDVITLRDGNGVIKGMVTEMVPGESISIIPSSAVLKLDLKDISGIKSKKTMQNESSKAGVDVVVLKNGTRLAGKILEQSPDKWVKIKVDSIPGQTYNYNAIEKIGKETVRPDDDIFKAYGIFEVVNLKNGDAIKGIIVEQFIGESIKIKTPDKGILIYDIKDIVSKGKEPYDKSKDIFLQSAFLDIVYLKNGCVIKGIITQQAPVGALEIETIGNSTFIEKMSDVVKFSKIKNTYPEGNNVTATEPVNSPVSAPVSAPVSEIVSTPVSTPVPAPVSAPVSASAKAPVTTEINDTSKNIQGKETITNDNVSVNKSDTTAYALLYVYRLRNFAGAAIGYNLKLKNNVINDSIIGRVKNNSKFAVKLYQEGKTEIWAKTESRKTVTIDVRFGGVYYLKCWIAMGVFVGEPDFKIVSGEVGAGEYEKVAGQKK